MDTGSIKGAIHTISTVLEIPAIIVLIIAVIIVVAELGSVIIEFFIDRLGRKLSVTKVLEELSGKSNSEMLKIIQENNFQRRQKRAFERLLGNANLSAEERKLFAVQLLSEEIAKQEKTLYVTDIIARIAPMFGLMATLIPLGPGLIALGQGDTKTLADSLLTAFDATVAGLAAAGIAFIISKIRKRWYQSDSDAMETIMEEVIL
jgi:biopolymer transport protein ExbB/TolQ